VQMDDDEEPQEGISMRQFLEGLLIALRDADSLACFPSHTPNPQPTSLDNHSGFHEALCKLHPGHD
jgi:hypothetical protein